MLNPNNLDTLTDFRIKPLPSPRVIVEIDKFVEECNCNSGDKDALFSIMLRNYGDA